MKIRNLTSFIGEFENPYLATPQLVPLLRKKSWIRPCLTIHLYIKLYYSYLSAITRVIAMVKHYELKWLWWPENLMGHR